MRVTRDTTRLSIGEIVPLRRSARAELAVPPSVADFGNVVPFARPRASEAHTAPELALPPDLVRTPSERRNDRVYGIAALALSLAVHGGLFAVLMREPPPLASIGLEVISVEIVVGATAPAGVAEAPAENETQSAQAPEPEQKVTPADEAEQKATEQPQQVETAQKETAPEEKAEPPKPEEPKQVETAAAQPEPQAQAEPEPQQFTLLPLPEEKPVEQKADAPPKQAAPPKPVKNAEPAKERRRIAVPTREKSVQEAKASAPSEQANNVGVGRSSDDTNYRGLVAAHLARYKQYPADARSRGEGGTAAVTFTVGGGGGVSSVRLARGSGIASIDQEVQEMVRRASPFPPPPGGRAQSFTVPVNFRLN